MGYQSQKKQAQMQEAANATTARNANTSHNYNLSLIEKERGTAAREKALEQFKLDKETAKEEAKLLNAGYGNPFRIMQDLGGKADLQWLDLENDFMADMNELMGQEYNSYAQLQRTYNQLSPVVYPNPLAATLQAGTAVGSYLMVPAVDRSFLQGYGKDAIKSSTRGASGPTLVGSGGNTAKPY
jgi:hypothetical protein